MGQYWIPVNLDKREYVDPHKLGTGLKLWEQLANSPGTGAALIILTAAMPEPRGGGDFDLADNWHGPERTNASPGPMPEEYPAVAARTIGRWAGDRIALVGDYAKDSDLAPEHRASAIYSLCGDYSEDPEWYDSKGMTPADLYTDVSDDVARVIEHELRGSYEGTGWRTWKREPEPYKAEALANLIVAAKHLGYFEAEGTPEQAGDAREAYKLALSRFAEASGIEPAENAATR